MEPIVRALSMYLFLLIVFRISGRRALAQISTFDFVLLLIISEATQQALLGEDFSITTAIVVITTLLAADLALAHFKHAAPRLERWVEGLPLVLVENGQPLHDLMRRARVDEDDILTAARERQGLERMDQIKYAILERSGGISIVPRRTDE
jgi:uncharacterized membrane protein YcaP (DUF421 family)